jgi:hypothetical protein
MSVRLWFGVGVRLLGLWEVLYGLDEVVCMFAMAEGIYHPATYPTPIGILPFAAFHLIVGGLLLKGAPLLTVWFYPTSTPPGTDRRDGANV